MKHCRLLGIAAALMLLPAAAALATNGTVFGFPNVNTVGLAQYAEFGMSQGWQDNKPVWFICTDASDQVLACSTTTYGEFDRGLNFAPRLVDLAGQVAIAYIITNVNQGPIFTAIPGDPTYSGLWQITYVTYKVGAVKHYVKNDCPYDAVTNPTGLPPASDADYTTAGRAGMPIVVKCPIMAVGNLGGPWYRVLAGSYRIPQAKVDEATYTRTKRIYLPFWYAYCPNPVTKRACVRRFIVPDVYDPPALPPADMLAPKLKANVAPGLGAIDLADMQDFYWQLGSQPLSQYPIFHACPLSLGESDECENFVYDYTPVAQVDVLGRNVPPLPASTIINNETLLYDLTLAGYLTLIRDTQVINAPILPEGQT
jgi:hypothetical protein